MRFLLVSIFVISLMGILLIPNAFGTTQIVIIPVGASSGDHFDPGIIEIKKDDMVKWANLDRNTAHTVTSTSTNWTVDSGDLLPNNDQNYCYPNCKPSFSYTFDAGGTYDYGCKIHSWMKGVVKVIEIGAGAELAVHGYAGDMYIDKSQYEVIEDGSVKIKIYGEVKDSGAGAYILFTITKPDGSTSELKTYRTGDGYYQLILSVNYEDRGTYNVVSTYGLENIGTANFVVVERTIPENLFPPSDDETSPLIQPLVSGNSKASNDLTVMTDFPSYKKGDMITISGMVPLDEWHASDFGDQGTSGHVIIQIFDPRNNMVTVSQFFPNNDTTYYVSFNGEGPMWKFEGDYTVKANFADSNAETKFAFTIPGTAFDSPVMESQAPSSSKTSTFLKLDSLDNTIKATWPKNGLHGLVEVSGQLQTIDRQFAIPDEEIKLVFTGFTYDEKDHYKITTGYNGKFDWEVYLPIGDGYAIQAVYDGSSNFKSSKSQTEYFDVYQQQSTAQPEDNSYTGILGLIVIGGVGVGIMIGIARARKKRTVTVPAGGGTAGTATITKASKPRKTPRAGRAPLLMGKIRRAKRAVGKQSPKAKSKMVTMHYLRCKVCLSEELENESDGQQYCTKCRWRKK